MSITAAQRVSLRQIALAQTPTAPPAPPAAIDKMAAAPTAYSGEMKSAKPPFDVALTEIELNDAAEGAMTKDGPKLVQYGATYDPTKEPIVLVHGMAGFPGHMKDIADRFVKEGRQVYFYFYDDHCSAAQKSGRSLAIQLKKLHAAYPQSKGLDIVAHSFGGIVARAALSSLEDPNWLKDDCKNLRHPRGGFPEVRVRSLDTPWQGYGTFWINVPVAGPIIYGIVHAVFFLIGKNAAWEMRAVSETLEKLFATELPGVQEQTISASQKEDARDAERSLEDMDEDDRLAVINFLLYRIEPSDPRVRNWCNMLKRDSRFAEAIAAVQTAVDRGRISDDDKTRTAALVDVFQNPKTGVMKPIAGDHMSIRNDPVTLDRLASELKR